MRVLISGDRNWKDKDIILEALYSLGNVDVVIEGGARGADTLGKEIAEFLGIPVIHCPADWSQGKKGGIFRNISMLNHKPDLVLAFHNDIGNSKGTKHMLEITKKACIPYRLYYRIGYAYKVLKYNG